MLSSKVQSARKAANALANAAAASFCGTGTAVVVLWATRAQLGANGDGVIACVAALGGLIAMALIVTSMMMSERAAEREILARITGAAPVVPMVDTVARRRG